MGRWCRVRGPGAMPRTPAAAATACPRSPAPPLPRRDADGRFRGWVNPAVCERYGIPPDPDGAWAAGGGGEFSFKADKSGGWAWAGCAGRGRGTGSTGSSMERQCRTRMGSRALPSPARHPPAHPPSTAPPPHPSPPAAIPGALKGRGWSGARAFSHTQLRKNPNAYFYRHVAPHEQQVRLSVLAGVGVGGGRGRLAPPSWCCPHAAFTHPLLRRRAHTADPPPAPSAPPCVCRRRASGPRRSTRRLWRRRGRTAWATIGASSPPTCRSAWATSAQPTTGALAGSCGWRVGTTAVQCPAAHSGRPALCHPLAATELLVPPPLPRFLPQRRDHPAGSGAGPALQDDAQWQGGVCGVRQGHAQAPCLPACSPQLLIMSSA